MRNVAVFILDKVWLENSYSSILKPSHPSHPSTYEDGTECSETSAYKIQTPGKYSEESTQQMYLFLVKDDIILFTLFTCCVLLKTHIFCCCLSFCNTTRCPVKKLVCFITSSIIAYKICAFYVSYFKAVTFNPLKTKRRPLYLKTQSVPRCKHFSYRL